MFLPPSKADIRAAIDQGFDILREALTPFVRSRLSSAQLREEVCHYYKYDVPPQMLEEKFKSFDVHKLLGTIKYLWLSFAENNPNLSQGDIQTLTASRNLFAHQQPISTDDATFWFQTMIRVLREIGATESAFHVIKIRDTLIDPVSLRPRTFSAPYTLLDGLEGLPGDQQDRLSRFLELYLGTAEVPAIFGGRTDQLRILDDWLTNPESPCALITGLAGRGKSALIAQWVQRLDRDASKARVVLMPISLRFNTADKSATLNILGARLRALHNDRRDLPLDSSLWNEEIRFYLTADRPADNPPLLVILDGADEALGWELGYDLLLPTHLGQRVKLLVSARILADKDANGWLRQLGWEDNAIHIDLPPLGQAEVNQVLEVVCNQLPAIENPEQFSKELTRLSAGDPLLIWLYLDALQAQHGEVALLDQEDLSSTPPGLKGYFDSWHEHQKRLWGSQTPLRSKEVEIVLDILCYAKGPLSIEDMVELGREDGLRSRSVQAAIELLARFLVGNDKQGYIFAHPRFGHYFAECLTARDRKRYAERFICYCSQIIHDLVNGDVQPQNVSAYVLRSYCLHVQESKAVPERLDLLLNKAWLDAHEVQEGTFEGYLADLEIGWKLVVTLGRESEHQAWAVGWQCRYILIRSSINSLTLDFPVDLLVALVAEQVWSPYQAIAYARRINTPKAQAEALTRLMPHFPQNLRREAVRMIELIPNLDPAIRCCAFAQIAPYVAAIEQKSLLERARQIYLLMDDTEDVVYCAAVLALQLNEDERKAIIDRAWERVQVIEGLQEQFTAVELLLPFLHRQHKQKLLTVIKNHPVDDAPQDIIYGVWGDESFPQSPQAHALAILAPFLTKTRLWKEAVNLARDISDARVRASMFGVLATQGEKDGDDLLQVAVETATPFSNIRERLLLLQRARRLVSQDEILQHYEHIEKLRRKVDSLLTVDHYIESNAPEDYTVQFVLQDILCQLPWAHNEDQEDLLARSLELVTRMRDADYVYSELKRVILAAKEFNHPLVILKAIEHLPIQLEFDAPRSYVLQKYIVWLAQSGYGEKVRALIGTLPKQERVDLLTSLSSALPPEDRHLVLREALAAQRNIRDHFQRVHSTVELFSRLPHDSCSSLARRLLQDIGLIDRQDYYGDLERITWLMKLFPYLGMEILDQILSEIRHLYSHPCEESRQVEKLKSIIQFLTWEHVAKELSVKHRRQWNTTTFPIFGARLVELGGTQQVLNLIRQIDNTPIQTLMLLDLLKRSKEEDRSFIYAEDFDLHGIFELFSIGDSEDIFEEALPYLSAPLMEQANAEIRGYIDDQYWFAARLTIIVLPHLPINRQYELLPDLLNWIVRMDEGMRQSLMPRLSEQLPYHLRNHVAHFVCSLDDAELRIEIQEWLLCDVLQQDEDVVAEDDTVALQLLESVTNVLPDQDIDTLLLKISDLVDDEETQARSLAKVAPQLLRPDHFTFVVNMIPQFTKDELRAQILVALTPHLPITYLPQALSFAREMSDSAARCESLLALVGRQPSELRATIVGEVVKAACEVLNSHQWLKLLTQLTPRLIQLNTEQIYQYWYPIAERIAMESRGEAQESLMTVAPILDALGGSVAIETAVRSALDVRDWFS